MQGDGHCGRQVPAPVGAKRQEGPTLPEAGKLQWKKRIPKFECGIRAEEMDEQTHRQA